MAATAISPPWLGLQARANEPTYKVRVQNRKKQKSRKNAKQGLSLPPPQGREEAWGSPLPVKALPRWLGVPADDMLRLDRRAISRRQKEKRGLPGQPGSPPSCEYFKVFESLSEYLRAFHNVSGSLRMTILRAITSTIWWWWCWHWWWWRWGWWWMSPLWSGVVVQRGAIKQSISDQPFTLIPTHYMWNLTYVNQT